MQWEELSAGEWQFLFHVSSMDNSAFSKNVLEKGKTGSRKLLQSSRQEKDGSGWTRMTIMEMEKRRIWHL